MESEVWCKRCRYGNFSYLSFAWDSHINIQKTTVNCTKLPKKTSWNYNNDCFRTISFHDPLNNAIVKHSQNIKWKTVDEIVSSANFLFSLQNGSEMMPRTSMRVCAHYGCHCWDSMRCKWCVVTLKIYMQTCPLSTCSYKCIMFVRLMNNLFYFTAIANGIFIVSPLVSINDLLKYSLECLKLCRCQHTGVCVLYAFNESNSGYQTKMRN